MRITLKLLQWSVTALASLKTALFLLRKDIYERMLAAKQLAAGEDVLWDKRLRGTMFLFVVALIFSAMIFLSGAPEEDEEAIGRIKSLPD